MFRRMPGGGNVDASLWMLRWREGEREGELSWSLSSRRQSVFHLDTYDPSESLPWSEMPCDHVLRAGKKRNAVGLQEVSRGDLFQNLECGHDIMCALCVCAGVRQCVRARALCEVTDVLGRGLMCRDGGGVIQSAGTDGKVSGGDTRQNRGGRMGRVTYMAERLLAGRFHGADLAREKV